MTGTAVRRINRGRGHSYTIDGRKAEGVTTLIKDGMPAPALMGWGIKTVANYAVDNWTDLEHLPVSARLERMRKSPYEQRDAAAKRGTEVHAIADQLSHGHQVDVPDELAGHVESAVKFLDDWQPTPVITETVIASRQWSYCGTLDLVADLPDGRRAIMDYKTSRSGIFGETALQLSAYARADVWIDAEGDEHSVEDLHITDALAVWIRGDGYDVYEVDISDRVFETFLHVATVARRAKGLRDWISPALQRPVLEETA